MITKTMTVTELRKELFDVVAAAKVNKQITDIMLHGEVVAEIRPKNTKKFNWVKYKKDLVKIDAVLAEANWSDVRKIRLESRKDRFPRW